jgi:NAD(P)H-flavin reductase
MDRLVPIPLAVRAAQRETSDTVTLHLDTTKHPAPFSFAPGQFNMLYAFGVGEIAVSMSGEPARSRELVHTIRAVGSVSRALSTLRRGAQIGVRGPFGKPWPLTEARGAQLILIAGGLGLAPLRPVVYEVLRERRAYGRVFLLVGARTPGDLLFRSELERWARRGEIEVLATVDRATADWRGRVGVAPALLAEVPVDAVESFAFVCGPEVMMRFTVRALLRRGLPEQRIYLSLERNMECGVGLCGHCQLGPTFVCKDGPILNLSELGARFWLPEV